MLSFHSTIAINPQHEAQQGILSALYFSCSKRLTKQEPLSTSQQTKNLYIIIAYCTICFPKIFLTMHTMNFYYPNWTKEKSKAFCEKLIIICLILNVRVFCVFNFQCSVYLSTISCFPIDLVFPEGIWVWITLWTGIKKEPNYLAVYVSMYVHVSMYLFVCVKIIRWGLNSSHPPSLKTYFSSCQCTILLISPFPSQLSSSSSHAIGFYSLRFTLKLGSKLSQLRIQPTS